MFVEGDIEELRKLVQKNLALAEENNHILRGMRRSARWGRFFTLAWWVIIIAVTGATYYIYVQPYVTEIEKAYGNTQTFEQQVQTFFHNFGSQIQTQPPKQQ
jgi:hypothetical protein